MTFQLADRKIGNASVPPIGFGAMNLSATSPYGPTGSDEERFKLLDAVYDAGYRHWDTSDAYGDSEIVLGKWFKRTGKRSEIYLATKFGGDTKRGDPKEVRAAIEKSLKQLDVEYVDLYYSHRPDPSVPVETTIGAMAELVKEGKVKNLGLSEYCANDVRRAHKVHPIAALQMEYNPFLLEIESEKIGIMDVAKELGITIVAWSPLAMGLVTGRFQSPDDFAENDLRRIIPKYSKENFPRVLEVVNQIGDIAKKRGITPGQVTLAWLLAQGDHIVVIPGTKTIKYVEENWGASHVQLSQEEIAAVRKVAEEAALVGDRLPDFLMAGVQRETAPLK